MHPSELILLDSDLRPKGGDIDDVAIQYCFADKADRDEDGIMEESVFPGHDFFNRWLPPCFQAQYGSLHGYWRTVHAKRRQEHVKQYLVDRMNRMMN